MSSVYLRPTAAADLDFVLAAEQAPENALFVWQWSRDRHLQACQDPNERHWVVLDPATQQRVGYTILVDIQDTNQSLLIKRIVIAPKGRGYGRATLEQVLGQAFLTFGAHRVWLDVMADNQRAHALYRSLGFVEEGKLRECAKTARGFLDMWIMSMLRSEFLVRQGERVGE